MSSLWTPDGERPVRQPSTPESAPGSDRGYAPQPGQPSPSEMAEMEAELRAMTEEIVSVPATAIIANHCVGLFQLAAAHLQVAPPDLPEARLAIDAMAAVVDGLKGRLGPDEGTLVDALAQMRLAYVQVQAGVSTE
jgi:hypothetical protein